MRQSDFLDLGGGAPRSSEGAPGCWELIREPCAGLDSMLGEETCRLAADGVAAAPSGSDTVVVGGCPAHAHVQVAVRLKATSAVVAATELLLTRVLEK